MTQHTQRDALRAPPAAPPGARTMRAVAQDRYGAVPQVRGKLVIGVTSDSAQVPPAGSSR